MMYSACRQLSTLVALIALLTGPAAASSVVYETVDLFKGKTLFTDTFQVDSAGNYQATLTDFEFPRPLKRMALNITTSKDTLGSLLAPGSFEFEADPGTYYVSFFALAGNGKKRDKDADRGTEHNKEKRKDRHNGKKHHQGKSDTAKQRQHKKRDRSDWAHGKGIENLGQYGIEIAYLDGMDNGMPPYEHPGNGSSSVVPVPAAAWLFLSGLLGISGIGFRRRLRG